MNMYTRDQLPKHNINIPGWIDINQLHMLGNYAASVPDHGAILELGALFGRTTYTLGMNKKDTVNLVTIDSWVNLPNIEFIGPVDRWAGGPDEMSKLYARLNGETRQLLGKDFFELWKEYTKDVVNNYGIQARTSIDNGSFSNFDFIFHDAGHRYNEVYDDLNHWFPKLKEAGILIVDDYAKDWPGVIQAVDQFVAENNLHTEMVTYRNILLRRKT